MQWIKDTLGWLYSCFQTFLDFFLEFPKKIWELICEAGQLFYDFFFHEETGLVWQMTRGVLESVSMYVDLLPDVSSLLAEHTSTFSEVMCLISTLNSLFPIVESLFFFELFIMFVISFLCIKIIWTVVIRGG